MFRISSRKCARCRVTPVCGFAAAWRNGLQATLAVPKTCRRHFVRSVASCVACAHVLALRSLCCLRSPGTFPNPPRLPRQLPSPTICHTPLHPRTSAPGDRAPTSRSDQDDQSADRAGPSSAGAHGGHRTLSLQRRSTKIAPRTMATHPITPCPVSRCPPETVCIPPETVSRNPVLVREYPISAYRVRVRVRVRVRARVQG